MTEPDCRVDLRPSRRRDETALGEGSGTRGGPRSKEVAAATAVAHSLLLLQPAALKHSQRDLVAWSNNLQNELRRTLAARSAARTLSGGGQKPWDLEVGRQRLALGVRTVSVPHDAHGGNDLSRATGNGSVAETAVAGAGDASRRHSDRRIVTDAEPRQESAGDSGADGHPAKGEPMAACEADASLLAVARADAVTAAKAQQMPSAVSPPTSGDVGFSYAAGPTSGYDEAAGSPPAAPGPAAAVTTEQPRSDSIALHLLKNLYFGDLSAAGNHRYLCREGIDALVVVSTVQSRPTTPAAPAPSVQCSCRKQHSRARLLANISLQEAAAGGGCYDEINKFIQLNRDIRRSVLICSSAADEQLAAVVAVQYAVRHADMPLDDALRRLRKPHVVSRTDLICLLQSAESRRVLRGYRIGREEGGAGGDGPTR